MNAELRKLPSVDKVLQDAAVQNLIQRYGRNLVVEASRAVLDRWRQNILDGALCPPLAQLVGQVREMVALMSAPTLRPVINATGVIIHTNLGRAPLSEAVLLAMREAAWYSNLEYDLERGERGSRYWHAEELLCRLSGAEGALLVNNNAGAVLLALTALARGREVVISRGQLVEIGGGFRIPEVMAQSGALLVEVGTTNRTYLRDYERAINERTSLLLRVHTSNFRLSGFVHQVGIEELASLAHGRGIHVLDDLGSGTFLDTAEFGLAHEPTVQESIAAGADLVCFSGDKLLGGPQAGIIVGKRGLVEQLREHPLARALRVDKTTIAGVQANLLHYLKGEALNRVPVWRMISMPLAELTSRAEALAAALAKLSVKVKVADAFSTVGGGSLPGEVLPSKVVALEVDSPDALARELRLGRPPVIARIEGERLILDLRTVLPGQEEPLRQAVEEALARLREGNERR